jgi:F-type H+-transporting ATPase subunit delta
MIGKKQAKREARQLLRLCRVNGLLDENRVRELAQHLIDGGSRDDRAILPHFLRWVRLDRAEHTANVESATPLPSDLQAAVQSSLTSLYGSGLTTAFEHRPSLIGGMRIQVGSDVYDGSVLARLTELEKSF